MVGEGPSRAGWGLQPSNIPEESLDHIDKPAHLCTQLQVILCSDRFWFGFFHLESRQRHLNFLISPHTGTGSYHD